MPVNIPVSPYIAAHVRPGEKDPDLWSEYYPNTQHASQEYIKESQQAASSFADDQGVSHYSDPQDSHFAEDNSPRTVLGTNTGIWKLYADYAKHERTWISKFLNEDLDVMLVFAGLFSTVVTAFLIESKKLLRQDPADTSVALLLMIAHLQRHSQLNLTSVPAIPVEIPPFSTPTHAIAVNVLWFFALSLSLIAALLALLTKEWLKHFNEAAHRDAQSQTLTHQAKIAAMKRWHGFEIIDLIPMLLHISLFLFAAGLVAYLWETSLVVSVVVLSAFAITALFCVATTILSALTATSPFVTRTSQYLRLLIVWLKQGAGAKLKTSPNLDVEKAEGPQLGLQNHGFQLSGDSSQEGNNQRLDQQANNLIHVPKPDTTHTAPGLRNPEDDAAILMSSLLQIYDELGDDIADDLIQALSTIHFNWELQDASLPNRVVAMTNYQPRHRTAFLQTLNQNKAAPVFLKTSDCDENVRNSEEHHRSARLTKMAIRRLKEITHNRQRTRMSSSPNIGSYAEVLANLCTYISSRSGGWSDWTNCETRSLLYEAIATLESIWHTSRFSITPDTSASVTASQFKLVFLIASHLGKPEMDTDGRWTSNPELVKGSVDRLAIRHDELLTRATLQLTFHFNGTKIISNAELVKLLYHINIATQSLGGLITVMRAHLFHYCLPKQATNTYPGFVVHDANPGTVLQMKTRVRELEVSKVLVNLAFPIPAQQLDREVQEVVQSTLKSITTILRSQQSSNFLSVENTLSCYDSNFIGINLTGETTAEGQVEHLLAEALATWPWDHERVETTQVDDLFANQILTLAFLFTLHGNLSPKNLEAADDIIQLLFEKGLHEIKPTIRSSLWRLITCKGVRHHCAIQKKSISRIQSRLLRLLEGMSNDTLIPIHESINSSDELNALMSLLANLPQNGDYAWDDFEVAGIFTSLKPSINIHLEHYLNSWEGLLSLLLVAQNNEYQSSVADFIITIVTTAADKPRPSELLGVYGLDSFLAAIGYVLRAPPSDVLHASSSDPPDSDQLTTFAESALRLLGDRSSPPEFAERSVILAEIEKVWGMISTTPVDLSLESIQHKLCKVMLTPNGWYVKRWIH